MAVAGIISSFQYRCRIPLLQGYYTSTSYLCRGLFATLYSGNNPRQCLAFALFYFLFMKQPCYIMSAVFAIAHIRAESFTINAKAKLESLPTILFPDESFSLFQTHAMIKRITLILPLLYIKKRENFSEVLAPVSSRFFHLSTVYKKLYSWRRAS